MQLSHAIRLVLMASRRPSFDGVVLEFTYDTKDAIPEKFRDLYTETDGKWHLTGVKGVKSQADIDRMNDGLTKERAEHKKTKEKLAAWTRLGESPEKVHERLDRMEELEEAAGGALNDERIEKLVEKRLKGKTASLTREVEGLRAKVGELETANTELSTSISRGKVEGAIRKAATDAGVRAEAIDDFVTLAAAHFEVAADGVIVTSDKAGKAGQTPEAYMAAQKDRRKYLWPDSVGGGSRGGQGGQNGANPWARDSWNITEQGRIAKEQGPEKAAALAKAAGVAVDAIAPAPAR